MTYRSLVVRPAVLRTAALLAGCAALLANSGCASSQRPVWGAQVSTAGALSRFRESIVDAAVNPRVWVPLTGAAVLQVNNWDRKVSDWARTNTPVFGSQPNAARWSDDLRSVSTWSYIATAVATPGADQPAYWFQAKAQGLAVGFTAIAASNAATAVLKQTTDRRRPNGADTESFPSGHASHSSVTTALARYNLSTMEMNEVTRQTLGIGLDVVTAGTAWARVEAGAHYPSDALVGIAIGSFFSDVLNQTFLEPEAAHHQALAIVPLKNGAAINWSVAF